MIERRSGRGTRADGHVGQLNARPWFLVVVFGQLAIGQLDDGSIRVALTCGKAVVV